MAPNLPLCTPTRHMVKPLGDVVVLYDTVSHLDHVVPVEPLVSVLEAAVVPFYVVVCLDHVVELLGNVVVLLDVAVALPGPLGIEHDYPFMTYSCLHMLSCSAPIGSYPP